MIKRIGTEARSDLEEMLGGKVFLDLHVKVRADWRDDERILNEMGWEAGIVLDSVEDGQLRAKARRAIVGVTDRIAPTCYYADSRSHAVLTLASTSIEFR